MKKVLVLCTGNSCRSQIAEGYLKHFAGNKAEIYSAGVEKHGVNPRAIKTMAADGIDISDQTSNLVTEYDHIAFDYLITVCDHAKERCPLMPGIQTTVHHNFPDPAKGTGTEEEIMQQFATVREQVKQFCREFVTTYLVNGEW